MADEYEVLYDWEPENPEDLRIFAGDSLIVLQKHEHGWWLGSIDRDGEVVKGYFPKNYVKEKPKVAAAPPPPPRPTRPTVPVPGEESVASLSADVAKISTTDAKKSSGARGFSLKSLPAFDDLMSKGFAVELSTPGASGTLPQNGEEVTLHCTAMTWDGASGGAKEYASGDLRFVVGKGSVVPGLEAAVQMVPVGQVATVTCSPTMAYGNAGFPPAVPPNSFVVFQITITGAAAADNADAPVQGPSQLFVADLPLNRRLSVHGARERIVLEPSSSTAAENP